MPVLANPETPTEYYVYQWLHFCFAKMSDTVKSPYFHP